MPSIVKVWLFCYKVKSESRKEKSFCGSMHNQCPRGIVEEKETWANPPESAQKIKVEMKLVKPSVEVKQDSL